MVSPALNHLQPVLATYLFYIINAITIAIITWQLKHTNMFTVGSLYLFEICNYLITANKLGYNLHEEP